MQDAHSEADLCKDVLFELPSATITGAKGKVKQYTLKNFETAWSVRRGSPFTRLLQ